MKQLLFISILFISINSCKKNEEKHKLDFEKSIAITIDTLVYRYLKLNRFSGTVLVSKEDSIIYSKHFGLADYENKIPFTDRTAFKIGDLSKLFTANIIKDLVSKNQLELKDKISKYFPEIKTHKSISHLLTDDTDSVGVQLKYNVLRNLIEKISGLKFQEYLDVYADSIGLSNTFLEQKNSSLAIGYLFSNYRGNGNELQPSPTYDLNEFFSSYGIKSTSRDLLKLVNPSDSLDIHGFLENDGFSYSLQNNPNSKTKIIVLSNRRHPVANEISYNINQILENKKHRLPLLRVPFKIDKNSLKDFSGNYSLNQNMSFEVINKNDSLFVMLGANKIYLVPQSKNQFYMEQVDASMRFLRDSANNVNEVVLLNGFLDGDRAKRLSD